MIPESQQPSHPRPMGVLTVKEYAELLRAEADAVLKKHGVKTRAQLNALAFGEAAA